MASSLTSSGSPLQQQQQQQQQAPAELASSAPARQRPLSCSAADPDFSRTSTTSSSSASSSVSSASAPRSLSTVGGSSGVSSTAARRTLVQPRPWRILHRSRMGSSLDRERAREEDTSLDGDVERKDPAPAPDAGVGSSVEGDEVFIVKKGKDSHLDDKPHEASQNGGGGSGSRGGGGGGSPVDAVVRAKSESDIAAHREAKNGNQRLVVFKTKAQRFSVRDDSKAAQRQSAKVPKSQTLPLASEPDFEEVPKPQTLPSESSLVRADGCSRRSQSGSRTPDGPKTVTFTEPEKSDLSPARSDNSSDKSDSPRRNVTLNVRDSSVRASFPKPAVSAKPPLSEKPLTAGKAVTLEAPRQETKPEKPKVPAKPARLSSSFNGVTPAGDPKLSPTSSSAPSAKLGPATPPKADGVEQPRRSSSTLESPKSPLENVLFSMGFTVADAEPKESQSKLVEGQADSGSEIKPKPYVYPAETNPQPETKLDHQTVDVVKTTDKVCEPEVEERNDFLKSKCETPVVPDPPEANTEVKEDKKPAKSKEKEIIPKKMIKIKGDKKAEEKAAKAKKKEQKAKEKELKSKKKAAAAASDDSDHEKGRVKLFSWKVEFSAKEKSPASQDAATAPKPKEDKKNKKERKKEKLTVKQTTPVLSPSETAPPPGGVQTEQEPAIEETVTAATSKKTEKGDGSSGSTSGGGGNKSPHDRKDPPSPQPPPEELQQQQQDQQQQQQQQEEASQMQDGPPQRQATPSPQPHHQQPQPPPQQPLPRQPPPKPKHLDDLSSSDQNSDLDSLYGSLRRSQGKSVQISESDGETTPQGSIGHGRRLAPRRHTVGGAQIREQLQLGDDIERKREAFYELLANRYPEYADKITGMALYQSTTSAERNPRPREPQRRRTTAVVYNPHSNRSLDYDDPGTMSDVELSSFQRGGYARTSLPIVRSASTSLERPIGLVFLVYRDETKKALLPNEITSLDTVRALFVRAFPEKLTMEFLDSPKRKIYILETATSIFFQLEDLRDIQDRTVLKIHECDSDEPQRVKSQPEIRGRAVQKAVSSSRPASRQGFVGESGSLYGDEMAKAQSLPVSTSQNYQDLMMKERAQWEMEQEYLHAQQRRSRSRSQTPEPAERPRSLSTGAPRSRYSHSPDRIPTPDRAPPHLNPIPENPRLLANGFRDAAMNGGHYETLPGVHSHPHHPASQPHPGPPGRVLSPTPMGQPIYESVYQAGGYPQSYVSHSMRAAPPQGPQRATGPPPDMRGNARGGPSSRHSLTFAAMSNPIYDSFPQRTQSYRVTPERDVLPARPQSATPHDMNRMERMEAQIASLAAWVHQVQASPSEPVQRRPSSSRSMSSGHSEGTDTYPGSSASSLSDIPAAYSLRQPVVTSDMREKINDMQCRMRELRVELQGLRRMEQLNQEAMRDAFTDTLARLKKVMSAVPGAENQVVRYQRMEVNALAEAYMQDKAKVEKELSDLESNVEELKEDVIARKCRVNVTDIEGLALLLSNVTKSLADLKARFPQVHESLKKVMAGEMEIVVKEEKFIKEEPLQIEAALKRCKKLTSTLYTLKRLATVQDARPPQIPSLAQECKEVGDHDKMAILESIRTMIPDHETRVQSLEAADASRERKKKFVTQHESLKFTKSLQAASKSLKHPDAQATTSGTEPGSRKTSAAEEMLDGKKCEPPVIPAKPARLLSASELKKSEAGSAAPETTSLHPTSSVSHTVTVTSQISDSGDKKAVDALPSSRSSARSVFFSSLQSPATSPTSQPEASKTVSKLPSASRAGSAVSSASGSLSATSLGAAAVSTSPSHSKPVSGVFYQALSPTRTRSAFSSIPLPSKPSSSEKEDSSRTSDKGKKVPPPPPPRKSSAKLPYGLGAGSAHSSNVNGGAEASLGRRDSGEKAPDSRKKDSALAYKASSPTSPGAVGPLSSTPKPATPQKPAINKFQKDLAAGIYANLNRPDLQHQRMVPDRLLTSMASPPPAAVTTNSQDPQDEGDLSGSESTGSSTSLDSQQGLVLLRGNSAASSKEAHSSPASRGPKPNPPQRHSSLSSKGSAASEESGARTKTQMLQERSRKSQDTAGSGSGKVSGSAFSQVNGLNSTKNGHKT